MKKKNSKRTVGFIFLVVFAIVTVLGFVFYDEVYTASGWFHSHPSGISLVDDLLGYAPNIVGSMQSLFVTLLVVYVFCAVVSKIFKGTPRKVTIGKLINSIAKVVIWVVGIIAVLAIWGVNVAALIAGAGVLTLVIGLGMQSLIADVIAGIFLVCDGTLQVGDIVTIDDWRGTVQEIGIRNTKLIDTGNNIRIANNSTIKVFVNLSREKSVAKSVISITYGEDIPRVEKIISENLETMREHLPLLTEGPIYKGVTALGSSSVDLLVIGFCKEEDIFQATRDLNRELKLLFDNNNVPIPFPQLDVHFDEPKK